MRCIGIPTKLLISACALTLLATTPLPAGEVTLKNGSVYPGTSTPVQGLTLKGAQQNSSQNIIAYPMYLVDDGMRRIFVPRRQVAQLNQAPDLARYEEFKLKQARSARKPMLGSLEGYAEVTPFNEFGQRTYTVNTQFGAKPLIVGVTKITPQLLTLTGLNYDWEHAIATTSVAPDILDTIIHKAIDPKNADDRMSVARLYLQAEMYNPCLAELDSIAKDFPERKSNVDEVRQQLRQLQAKLVLQELRHRKAAGQHKLAYDSAKKFPNDELSEEVRREVRELLGDYDGTYEKSQKALKLLEELQAKLPDQTIAAKLTPFRTIVRDELGYETLPRLEPFLNLASDQTLAPNEKLALAYSGWVLGSAGAITDLNSAISLWKGRLLITDFLKSDSQQERSDLLTQLQGSEGVSIERVAQIVRLLTPTLETPNLKPMQPLQLEVADGLPDTAPKYEVLLPEEYSPHHSYPVIVALHPSERTANAELVWWGGTEAAPGQASRHGYIVIAPEYLPPKTRSYDYSMTAHDVVQRSILDARKRFRIDSDRIFLTGHGAGADAAFDIGMSHPDLFAGVIPISGVCDHYCRWYWENARQTAFYIVGGELDMDRDTPLRDTSVVNKMMVAGLDLTYVEYMGRGYESYYEEIHRLFDWMGLHRRQKYLKQFEYRVLRTSENRNQWVRAEEFPPNVTESTVLGGKSRGEVTAMILKGAVSPGKNVVTITSGAKRHTLWFSPEIVSFDERLSVKKGGRQYFNDFLKPSIATLLEDLRLRGDREMLFTARVDIQ